MLEQIIAIATITFLLVFWKGLNAIGDKGDKRFFTMIFPLAIVGVFCGGVLNLW